MVYESTYGLDGNKSQSQDDIDCQTMFRGTLRYEGFSHLMYVFKRMGLFDTIEYDHDNNSGRWDDLLIFLLQRHEKKEPHRQQMTIESFFLQCASGDTELAMKAQNCWNWLTRNENNNDNDISSVLNDDNNKRVVDIFCSLLESNLRYETNERDMIIMHHSIMAEFQDGRTTEEHLSSLQVFGDDGKPSSDINTNMTAMCKTVGYPTAAAADLILKNNKTTKGLLLPTKKEIYLPILEQVKEVGIVFDEKVKVSGHEVGRNKANFA